MISKLQIKNFRHNERLNVELDRITVFRGPSGSGKSSLLGALKWVVFNQPSGMNFVHWDHDFSAVRLTVDGKSVTRKRSKSENTYRLNKSTYKAFGTGVPSEVASLLSLTILNFQRQHAGPFWFRETAGEVSRQLNSIVNLELIDTTLANIDKEQRAVNWKVTYHKEEIEKAKEEKRKLRWVVALDKKLQALEIKEQEHSENAERIELLSNLLTEAKQHKEAASQTIPDIKPLLKLQKQWEDEQTKYEQLTELFGSAEEYEHVIAEFTDNIKSGEKELKRLMGKWCPLCGNQLKTKT